MVDGGVNEQAVKQLFETKEFVRCSDYFDKQYKTDDGDCWSVKCQPR